MDVPCCCQPVDVLYVQMVTELFEGLYTTCICPGATAVLLCDFSIKSISAAFVSIVESVT
jgi:hypothetical protein